MEASLDTNVIIHLYKAKLQSVLFNRFQKLKVYEIMELHKIISSKTSRLLVGGLFVVGRDIGIILLVVMI